MANGHGQAAGRAIGIGRRLWALCLAIAAASVSHAEGFAVVELFTSEGCHSCPPADRLASQIVEDAQREGLNVFVLAYHVDYWDRYGWTDPYSDARFSARQQAYAARWGAQWGESRVYTPQMVVNGRAGFVGSDAARAEQEIENAVQASAETAENDAAGQRMTLTIEPAPGGDLDVIVVASGAGAHASATVVIAVVEDELTSDVTRGENAGKTLRHNAVVRAFEVRDAADEASGLRHDAEAGTLEGAIRIDVLADVELANTRVIGFVQSGEAGPIEAAAMVRVLQSPGAGGRE